MFTGTLSINQGDYFSYSGIATDSNNNVLNLSGMTGVGYIKLKYGDIGILDQFHFNITNAQSGYYNISLMPSSTSAYPVAQGIYGITVFTNSLNSNPYQAEIAKGYLNIFPELVSNFSGLFTGVNSGCNGRFIIGGSF